MPKRKIAALSAADASNKLEVSDSPRKGATNPWLLNFFNPNWLPNQERDFQERPWPPSYILEPKPKRAKTRAERAKDREEARQQGPNTTSASSLVKDLTKQPQWRSEWISFEGRSRASIIIEGVRGCTVVAAFSSRGMLAMHLWEGQMAEGDKPRYVLNDMLTYGAGIAPLKKTMTKVRKHFAKHRAKLEGGKIIVMLPLAPWKEDDLASSGNYRYAEVTWEKLDEKGFVLEEEPTVVCPELPQMIIDAVKEGSGLDAGRAYTYRPHTYKAEQDRVRALGSPSGTFAMLFDTNLQGENVGDEKVGVWIDGWQVSFPTPNGFFDSRAGYQKKPARDPARANGKSSRYELRRR